MTIRAFDPRDTSWWRRNRRGSRSVTRCLNWIERPSPPFEIAWRRRSERFPSNNALERTRASFFFPALGLGKGRPLGGCPPHLLVSTHVVGCRSNVVTSADKCLTTPSTRTVNSNAPSSRGCSLPVMARVSPRKYEELRSSKVVECLWSAGVLTLVGSRRDGRLPGDGRFRSDRGYCRCRFLLQCHSDSRVRACLCCVETRIRDRFNSALCDSRRVRLRRKPCNGSRGGPNRLGRSTCSVRGGGTCLVDFFHTRSG